MFHLGYQFENKKQCFGICNDHLWKIQEFVKCHPDGESNLKLPPNA